MAFKRFTLKNMIKVAVFSAMLALPLSGHAQFSPFNGWNNGPWNSNSAAPYGAPAYAPAPWGYPSPMPYPNAGYPNTAYPGAGYPPVAPYPVMPPPRKKNNSTPWGDSLPWNNSPWSKNPFGNISGPWDNGPWNSNWSGGPWGDEEGFWDHGPGRWFDPEDPKGSMANMWDDMLEAPSDLGEMPGGWTAPNIKVPNPVEVGDEFEGSSRLAPAEAAEQLNNFKVN